MDWESIGALVARAVIAYAVVVGYVRVSGNRTLAKMRAFDFLVTVALGTLLATSIVSDTVPLWRGLLAIGLLILLQWVVARLSVHSRRFDRIVTNESVLLYDGGRYDERAMRRARVTMDEIRSAIRQAGLPDESGVKEVRLETSGELSVVRSR